VNDVTFERMRIVACDAWGIPPWEFDQAAESGLIGYSEVRDACYAKAVQCINPLGLLDFAFPGTKQVIEQHREDDGNRAMMDWIISHADKDKQK
jgi:hypothetical protein